MAFAWASMIFVGCTFAFILALNIGLVPIFALVMPNLIGYVANQISSEVQCPECNAIFDPNDTTTASNNSANRVFTKLSGSAA